MSAPAASLAAVIAEYGDAVYADRMRASDAIEVLVCEYGMTVVDAVTSLADSQNTSARYGEAS